MNVSIDPDAPWWVNLVVVVVVVLGSNWLMNKPTRKALGLVAIDAKTAADQTANSHSDAEYPNLRDEMTAARQTTEGLVHAVAGLVESQQGVRDDIGGLHSEMRDARKDIAGLRTDGRRDRREIADQRTALEAHVAACGKRKSSITSTIEPS